MGGIRKLLVLIVIFLINCFNAGCDSSDSCNIETLADLVPGESAFVSVCANVGVEDDSLNTCYADIGIGKPEIDNFDVDIISSGIIEQNRCGSQVKITAHNDAISGNYEFRVNIHATYYSQGRTENTVVNRVVKVRIVETSINDAGDAAFSD